MDQDKKLQSIKPLLIILWGALLVSHLVFTLVIPEILRLGALEPKNDKLFFVFIGIGVLNVAIGAFANKRAYNPEKFQDPEFKGEALQQLFSLSVLSWALFESVTVLGILGYISLGFTLTQLYGFGAAGIALHILHFPKLKLVQSYQN